MATQNPDGDLAARGGCSSTAEGAAFARATRMETLFSGPVVALAQYLAGSGDASVLDENVRVSTDVARDSGEAATVWEHVERALALIENAASFPAPHWPPRHTAAECTHCNRRSGHARKSAVPGP